MKATQMGYALEFAHRNYQNEWLLELQRLVVRNVQRVVAGVPPLVDWSRIRSVRNGWLHAFHTISMTIEEINSKQGLRPTFKKVRLARPVQSHDSGDAIAKVLFVGSAVIALEPIDHNLLDVHGAQSLTK